MRICKKCHKLKPLTDFYRVSLNNSYRRYDCNSCNKKRALEHRQKMKEAGKCISCGAEAVNKMYCAYHRKFWNKYQNNRNHLKDTQK